MIDPSSSYDDVRPEVQRARRTTKWNHFDVDVLPLWIAEMDFATAPVVLDAIREAVAREEFGYPRGDEATGVCETTADWFERRYGVFVDPGRVRMLPDVMKGVELAISAFSPESSPIVLPTPAYMPFFELAKVVDRPLMEVPMARSEDRFALDLDGIDAAFTKGAKTLILCNPYNPLGRNFSLEELRALAVVVERHGARVVADEIHGPITYGRRYVPYSSVSVAAANHSATIVSASKAFNLPGLKCAQVLITSEADARVWSGISNLSTHGASTIGIEATVAAYRDGAAWLDQTLAYLDDNRRLLAELVAEHLPLARYQMPEATYLAWLDLSAYGLFEEPAGFLLQHARVALNPGLAFGRTGAGCVRLNFATSAAILVEAVEKMAAALSRR